MPLSSRIDSDINRTLAEINVRIKKTSLQEARNIGKKALNLNDNIVQYINRLQILRTVAS